MTDEKPQYKILAGRTTLILSQMVNEYIDEGYRPYCGPYSVGNMHFQAIMKTSGSGVNWDFLNKINGCETKEE
jgi:hypothetical protein